MNCFPCFSSQKSKKTQSKRENVSTLPETPTTKVPDIKKQKADEPTQDDPPTIQAKAYTFRELATATKNFRQECLLGEGGFGRAYKGTIPTTGQVVAIKQLDRNGLQGSKEFLAEVSSLSLLHHENLVDLIGYCADGDQRLLVYEYVPGGSVEDRLLDCGPEKPPLDWFARIKIAVGAGKGLEYLHEQANPPIIYRELKSSNILLDDNLNPRLSDFGLAKLSGGDKASTVPSRVVGTYGYCAPEYVSTGQFTLKSDVYSFGVVLLELITGRRVIDTTKPNSEQNLVSWAQPLFRDPKRFPDMADPLLKKCFPEKDLNQAVAVAAMCLQEEAAARPLISDIVTTLSFLSVVPPKDMPVPLDPEPLNSESEKESEKASHSSSISDDEDGDASARDHNQTTKNRVTFSENYQDSENDDSDVDDKSDKENQSPRAHQDSKSSPKNSKKSRTGSRSSSGRSGSFTSDDASVSSSQNSSKESHNSSQKKSKKVSSSKSSVESEDGFILNENNQSKASGRTSSVGSEAENDFLERRASRGNSQGSLDHNSSRRSDHDVNKHSENSSSSESEDESVHS